MNHLSGLEGMFCAYLKAVYPEGVREEHLAETRYAFRTIQRVRQCPESELDWALADLYQDAQNDHPVAKREELHDAVRKAVKSRVDTST